MLIIAFPIPIPIPLLGVTGHPENQQERYGRAGEFFHSFAPWNLFSNRSANAIGCT
jgi:hypothetical protein